MGTRAVTGRDIKILCKQLGREARGVRAVAARCELGCPSVIETEPFIDGKKPFPTLFWLSCPQKVEAVSRLEDEGWAERLRELLARDPALLDELASAHDEYRRRRIGAAGGVEHPALNTGIAGVRDPAGVKCLHAHYAHYLASGTNPIGRLIDEKIGEETCSKRCDAA